VGEKSWTYQTRFKSPALSSDAKGALVFEGLDTFATVKLNGKTVLESSNMFLSHYVDITNTLSKTDENVIEIDFASALIRGRELEKEHPEYRFIAHNGESGRVGVRKAQYHWVRWSLSLFVSTDKFIGMGLGTYTYDGWSMAAHPTRSL
jgi:beta-mannosidase